MKRTNRTRSCWAWAWMIGAVLATPALGQTATPTMTPTPISGNPATSLNAVTAATATGTAIRTDILKGAASVWFHAYNSTGTSDSVVDLELSLDGVTYHVAGTATNVTSRGEMWVCPITAFARASKTGGTVGAASAKIWTSPQPATACHRVQVAAEATPTPAPTPTATFTPTPTPTNTPTPTATPTP